MLVKGWVTELAQSLQQPLNLLRPVNKVQAIVLIINIGERVHIHDELLIRKVIDVMRILGRSDQKRNWKHLKVILKWKNCSTNSCNRKNKKETGKTPQHADPVSRIKSPSDTTLYAPALNREVRKENRSKENPHLPRGQTN